MFTNNNALKSIHCFHLNVNFATGKNGKAENYRASFSFPAETHPQKHTEKVLLKTLKGDAQDHYHSIIKEKQY